MGLAILPSNGALISGLAPWYRISAVAISQANAAMSMFNLSTSATFRFVAPYGGRCLGWHLGLSAQISAGSITVEFRVGAVVKQSTAYTSANTAPLVTLLATPGVFVAGDSLDFSYSSDASIAGPASFIVQPIYVYN